MWNTTNGLGQQVTWYSEEDIKKYKQVLKKIESCCSWVSPQTKEANCLKKLILEIIKECKDEMQI